MMKNWCAAKKNRADPIYSLAAILVEKFTMFCKGKIVARLKSGAARFCAGSLLFAYKYCTLW